MLTGSQELIISLGNTDEIGSANVELTGIALTTAIGSVDAVSVVDVTGVSASTGIGSLNIVTNVVINVTGVSAQSSVGSVNITAWAEVSTGTPAVYSQVSTGTPANWTEC
jgi:hypothetical protein